MSRKSKKNLSIKTDDESNKALLEIPLDEMKGDNSYTKKKNKKSRSKSFSRDRAYSSVEKGSKLGSSRARVLSEDEVHVHHTIKEMARRAVDSRGKKGISSVQATILLQEHGLNQLPENKTAWWITLLSYFWGPMPIMIWIAIILEAALQSWNVFGVLMALQMLNGFVGYYMEMSAGNAVDALKESLAKHAFVYRDDELQEIDAKFLVPGDWIHLKLGQIIPADAVLIGDEEQSLEVDQSALTGESLPVTIFPGSEPLKMGSVIVRGEMDAIVTHTGANCFFGRAAAMLNAKKHEKQEGIKPNSLFNCCSSEKREDIEEDDDVKLGDGAAPEGGYFKKLVIIITVGLMILSIVLVLGIFIKLAVSKLPWIVIISVCVTELIASIPIAMLVVCTSQTAIGATRLANAKAIVTRMSSIEELARMEILCSDKTGTLTLNKLSLHDPIVYSKSIIPEEITFLAAASGNRSLEGQDAIDKCLCDKARAQASPYGGDDLDALEEIKYIPFDPVIKRTEAILKQGDETIYLSKGAPQVIVDMCILPESTREKVMCDIQMLADRGYRAIAAARGKMESGKLEWELLGLLSLSDPPRHDTKETIENAQALGVEVKMITGDHESIAKDTCLKLGMGTNIHLPEVLNGANTTRGIKGKSIAEIVKTADGFARVMPEDKYAIVGILRQQGYCVGMTGDGVNDAPALKAADVGIAVDDATDAARAASDLVLTEPGLSVIIDAIKRARKIFCRMRNYIIYRIACTIQIVLFFFMATMIITPRWFFLYDADSLYDGAGQPFRLLVICLCILVLVNGTTIITIAYDHVRIPSHPTKWNLWEVSIVASTLGIITVISSVVILYLLVDSARGRNGILKPLVGYKHYSDDQFKSIFSPADTTTFGDVIDKQAYITYADILALMYMKICVSDYFTVFSARTRDFFFRRRAGLRLFGAFILATGFATIIASFVSITEGERMCDLPKIVKNGEIFTTSGSYHVGEWYTPANEEGCRMRNFTQLVKNNKSLASYITNEYFEKHPYDFFEPRNQVTISGMNVNYQGKQQLTRCYCTQRVRMQGVAWGSATSIAVIWLWNIVWFIIMDCVKVLLYILLDKIDAEKEKRVEMKKNLLRKEMTQLDELHRVEWRKEHDYDTNTVKNTQGGAVYAHSRSLSAAPLVENYRTLPPNWVGKVHQRMTSYSSNLRNLDPVDERISRQDKRICELEETVALLKRALEDKKEK